MVRQASQAGAALSLLYRSIYVWRCTAPTQAPVRYVAVFTDGGAEKDLRQHGVDNMCAPVAPFYHQLSFVSSQFQPFVCLSTQWLIGASDLPLAGSAPNLWESYRSARTGQHQRHRPALGAYPQKFLGVLHITPQPVCLVQDSYTLHMTAVHAFIQLLKEVIPWHSL